MKSHEGLQLHLLDRRANVHHNSQMGRKQTGHRICLFACRLAVVCRPFAFRLPSVSHDREAAESVSKARSLARCLSSHPLETLARLCQQNRPLAY